LEFEMTDAFTLGLGTGAPRPRLLDMAREAIRRRNFSYRTEQSYSAHKAL